MFSFRKMMIATLTIGSIGLASCGGQRVCSPEEMEYWNQSIVEIGVVATAIGEQYARILNEYSPSAESWSIDRADIKAIRNTTSPYIEKAMFKRNNRPYPDCNRTLFGLFDKMTVLTADMIDTTESMQDIATYKLEELNTLTSAFLAEYGKVNKDGSLEKGVE